jgi:bis(5'-nucleosyl)-tetraphosphatase (symmetrical)
VATWAIGDVHGCYRTLRRLLARRELARGDRLWFVGDLVNRGPRSLETLRFVADLGDRATVVLGNHDVHFLTRAAGLGEERRRDTLDRLLAARDLGELAAWLRARPLLVAEGSTVLVHAGLRGGWSAAGAERRARRVERALRSRRAAAYLAAYRPTARHGGPDWGADPDLVDDLRIFTLLRTVSREGDPLWEFAGPPGDRPRGAVPWFDLPGRRSAGRARVLFGHWAALGLMVREDAVALDTGCVWGNALTAMRVEDRRIVQQENVE